MSSGDKVWIFDEGCVGFILQYGTFFSLVSWEKDGIIHEEYLESSEFLHYERLDEDE